MSAPVFQEIEICTPCGSAGYGQPSSTMSLQLSSIALQLSAVGSPHSPVVIAVTPACSTVSCTVGAAGGGGGGGAGLGFTGAAQAAQHRASTQANRIAPCCHGCLGYSENYLDPLSEPGD